MGPEGYVPIEGRDSPHFCSWSIADLSFIQALPYSEVFNPKCRGQCWFDLTVIVPFAIVGASLILVAYYRRKNRKLRPARITQVKVTCDQPYRPSRYSAKLFQVGSLESGDSRFG
jgi:hypothetical protein